MRRLLGGRIRLLPNEPTTHEGNKKHEQAGHTNRGGCVSKPAVPRPAKASLMNLRHIFKLVVKGQLLSWLNILQCEDPNSGLTVHGPFLGLTVRVAGVIDEPRRTPLIRSVNNALVVEGQEVKVGGLVLFLLKGL